MKPNLDIFLNFGRKIIPQRLFKKLQPAYHWLMAFLSALLYCFPPRKIVVVGVTGTKGKTSTIEIINTILEEAGYKTALVSSLHFKINKELQKNELKMTMPGRFFIQRFLRKAVKEKCRYSILELTSEGAVQQRHKFIKFNTLIFTNLSPEHIESHGSFENYRGAKLKFFKTLEKSKNPPADEKGRKIIIINEDDPSASYFLDFDIPEKIKYGLKNLESYNLSKDGVEMVVDNTVIKSKLSGEFNLYNILAAIAFARSQNIGSETIKTALEKFLGIPGRMEEINEGQNFRVIIDYAHTPDSLKKVYETFQASRKICVLGSAGGGRDKWKRPKMGEIASGHCQQVILTNEDPYDENPRQIIEDIKGGILSGRCEIIMDRRKSIRRALQYAWRGDTVIITGKGAEPWIMGPRGSKTAWDDRLVAREELRGIKNAQT